MTEPSPRIVLPLNIVMWRRIGATGLTTISSVSNTRSTMMPSMFAPTCATTMVEASPVLSSSSSSARFTSGSSRSRSRSTGVSLICSITLAAAESPGRTGAHQFDDADLRNRKSLAAGFDHQGRDDREGERDFDREGAAAPDGALEIDRAADALDIGLYHVHSDATPRDGGDVGGCGESGAKDESLDLRLGHAGKLRLARQPLSQRLRADALDRQAPPVVGDLDHDVAALVEGVERDPPGLRLARGPPLGRPLQSVVGRVPHHMRQRVLDQLQHLAVEFGLGAAHRQFDPLVELVREVAHQARQLAPGIADRLHARLHDAFLQVGGDVREPLQRHRERAVLLRARELHQLVSGEHEFAHQGHEVFEHVDRDPDRLPTGVLGSSRSRGRG